jgi:hypothetical protein
MAELLLVSNPKRRRRRRKMTAKQRRYFGKKRRRATSHRRRRRTVAAAPRRHRRRRAVAHVTRRRRRNPVHHHRRRYRRHRNPLSLGGFTGRIMPTAKAGLTGASGALMLDAAWGFLAGMPALAPYLGNQYVGFAAKGVTAVAVGALGGKILRGKSQELATGAMTVVVHDFLKALLQSTFPSLFGPGGSVPLGSYLSGSAPIVGTATVPQAYLPFGSYLSGSDDGSGVMAPWASDTLGIDPWGGSDTERVGYDYSN